MVPTEQFQNLIAMLAAAALPDDATVDDWRLGYDALGAMLPMATGVEVTPVDAGGVPGEMAASPAAEHRHILYLHGGGYVIGSLDSHRSMATHLAAAAAADVLLLDYRRAPEAPFPAALEDAVLAYGWLLECGADPARTVVAGDSAGGGLTVATLLALRDRGIALPAAGVCLSPWTDLACTAESITTRAAADPMVRSVDLERWASTYLAGADPRDPLASPLYADLAGLPPLLVHVGGREVLHDDATRLAERARAAGVETELLVEDEMIHVWHFFAGMVPEADEALARVAAFIRARARAR
jgi:epsilon-lactone hydrolase